MAVDFNRALKLMDAVVQQTLPVPRYAEDEDLQHQVKLLLEQQGHSVSKEAIQTAAQALDQRDTSHHPVIPLPVTVPPLKSSWLSRRRQKPMLTERWKEVFLKVRAARQKEWGHQGELITAPLSPEHASELRRCLGKEVDAEAGLHPVDPVKGEEDKNACVPAVLHTVYGVLNYSEATGEDRVKAQQSGDVGLLIFLCQHGVPFQKEYRPTQWHFRRELFWPRSRMSLLDMSVRLCSHEVLRAWDPPVVAPATWEKSLLWWVLVSPLLKDRDIQRLMKVEGWEKHLENTVRWVLMKETTPALHARVIQEAVALCHPHAEWLARWLPDQAMEGLGIIPP